MRVSRAPSMAQSRSGLTTSRTTGAAGGQTDSGSARTGRPKTRARTAESTTGTSWGHEVICAITESKGVAPIVGLGFVNLGTAEAVLSQIVDNQSYVKTLHKLTVLDPTTIIVPQTAVHPTKSKLMHILQMNLSGSIYLKDAPRKYWDETAGVDYIHQFALEDEVEALKVSIGGNFFAICSLAAALRYVDAELGWTISSHSMRMRSLELIQNLHDARSKGCLLGLLDTTHTSMGSRLLRGNILQPLTTKPDLERRYDAVDDLLAHMEAFTAVRQALKAFLDIDKVLTEIVITPSKPAMAYFEQSINNVLLIKQCIRAVPPLHEALTGVHSNLLKQIRDLLEPQAYAKVSDFIDDTINADVTFQKKPVDLRNQRTYAVKAGVNEFLDIARQTYSEATRDAQALLEELSETHGLNLELKYEPGRHYFFTLPVSDLEERSLPPIFVNVIKKKHSVECSTLDLVKLNQKIVDSHHEVLQMSDKTIFELINRIRENVAPLFRISDGIALLDMLASFADSAAARDYCRPELLPTLAIQKGRHPIQEKVHRQKFVPNDIYASPKTSRLQIITGCNMSGKSTYIRAIALITVMAQTGSFVPANYASVPIRHELFARLSVDDSSTSGISTFAEEMREMAFILRNIDAHALVIIDELGRATSTRDGLAIAIAVVEALLESRALVWFVTHFHDLAKFLAERPGLVNRHLEVDVHERHISMLYRVANGPTPPENHGLLLARAVGLPPDVLQTASHVAHAIVAENKKKAQTSSNVLEARRAKLLFAMKEQIIQARDGRLAGNELTNWLVGLQNEFIRRMSALDEEEKELSTLATSDTTEMIEMDSAMTHGVKHHEEENTSDTVMAASSSPPLVGSRQQTKTATRNDPRPSSESCQTRASESQQSELVEAGYSPHQSRTPAHGHGEPPKDDYRRGEPATTDVTMTEPESFQPLEDELQQSLPMEELEGSFFSNDPCIREDGVPQSNGYYMMSGALSR